MTTPPWAHSLASSSSLTGPALAEAPESSLNVSRVSRSFRDRGLDEEESGKGLTGTKVNQLLELRSSGLHRELSHEQDPLQEGLSEGSGNAQDHAFRLPRDLSQCRGYPGPRELLQK